MKRNEPDATSGGASAPDTTTTAPSSGRAAVAAPPRLRRSPVLALAGLGLVVIGALAAVWVYLSSSEAVESVAVRQTVMRGQTVEAGDLVTVRVSPDPALQLVPGSELDSFVGLRAALDLSAGSLLTREAVAAEVVPGEGYSVVGLALTPALMPGQPLQAGDSVRVVATPGQGGDPSTFEAAGTLFGAEVVAVSTPPVEFSTETVVSVLVPEGQAADLARWASAGRVALVLDSREGD